MATWDCVRALYANLPWPARVIGKIGTCFLGASSIALFRSFDLNYSTENLKVLQFSAALSDVDIHEATIVDRGIAYFGGCHWSQYNKSFSRCTAGHKTDMLCSTSDSLELLLQKRVERNAVQDSKPRRLKGGGGGAGGAGDGGGMCGYRMFFEAWFLVQLEIDHQKINRCAFPLGVETYGSLLNSSSFAFANESLDDRAVGSLVKMWVPYVSNSCVVGFGNLSILDTKVTLLRESKEQASMIASLCGISALFYYLVSTCIFVSLGATKNIDSGPAYAAVPTDAVPEE